MVRNVSILHVVKVLTDAPTALETLVTSLHSHLERLSLEMQEQGRVLSTLLSLVKPLSSGEGRAGEQAEAQAQKAAMEQEAEKVRSQVERLACEVETLREVVEEGLRGRDTTDEEEEMEMTDVDEEQHEEEAEDDLVGDEVEEDEAPIATPTSEDPPRPTPDLIDLDVRVPSPSLKPAKRHAPNNIRMTLRSPDASVSRSLTEEFERCKLQDSTHSGLNFNPETSSSSRGGVMRTSTPPPSAHRSMSTTPSTDPPSLLIAQSQGTSQTRSRFTPVEDPFPRLDGNERRREKRSTPPPRSNASSSPRLSQAPLPQQEERGETRQRRRNSQESDSSSRSGTRRHTNVAPPPAEESIHSHQPQAHDLADHAPKMRTARLEKMFVDAPEHDEARCTACRRIGTAVPVDLQSRRAHRERVTARKCSGAHEQAPETQDSVMRRILKELEDDFAHYKRWVILFASFFLLEWC